MRQTAWVISWLKNSSLQLQDSFLAATKKRSVRLRFVKSNRWLARQFRQALRIDYVFASQNEQPVEYEVVFDGQRLPIVSDQFWYLCGFLNNQE